MTDAPDLEPAGLAACPFCGGEAILRGHQAPEFWVACNGFGCKASTEGFGSKEKAIAAWNRRAASSAPKAVVKPLEWRPDRTGWQAYSIVGIYNVLNGQWWRLNKVYRSPEMRDEDAAKAAAQADYEQRILSALASSPAPTGLMLRAADELDRLREVEKHLREQLTYADEHAAKVEALLEPHIKWDNPPAHEPGTIRICPMRDGPCRHGMHCPYVGDGYMGYPCKEGWNGPRALSAQVEERE